MQKARGHPFPAPTSRCPALRRGPAEIAKWGRGIGLPPLVGTWFQVLFTPLVGVLFTVRSLYLCAIGRPGVLSLGGWTPQLHTAFHEHRATLGHLSTEGRRGRLQDCHLLWSAIPDRSAGGAFVTPRGPATPRTNFPCRRAPRGAGAGTGNWCGVWAVPRSLAATDGVSVDFLSDRY